MYKCTLQFVAFLYDTNSKHYSFVAIYTWLYPHITQLHFLRLGYIFELENKTQTKKTV